MTDSTTPATTYLVENADTDQPLATFSTYHHALAYCQSTVTHQCPTRIYRIEPNGHRTWLETRGLLCGQPPKPPQTCEDRRYLCCEALTPDEHARKYGYPQSAP